MQIGFLINWGNKALILFEWFPVEVEDEKAAIFCDGPMSSLLMICSFILFFKIAFYLQVCIFFGHISIPNNNDYRC
jgi:hypothetical protein